MDEKKLLEDYIKLFGDEPPFPPVHIIKLFENFSE